jgi:hypothetical protein
MINSTLTPPTPVAIYKSYNFFSDKKSIVERKQHVLARRVGPFSFENFSRIAYY